jgi:hypothetical protein
MVVLVSVVGAVLGWQPGGKRDEFDVDISVRPKLVRKGQEALGQEPWTSTPTEVCRFLSIKGSHKLQVHFACTPGSPFPAANMAFILRYGPGLICSLDGCSQLEHDKTIFQHLHS